TVQTTVSVLDGETVAIGGLITATDKKNENKLPWLGDLPFIGAAFRYRQQIKTKTELLVILTPHIVHNKMEADRMLAVEAKRMDWVINDVVKTHGTTGFEPILPPPPPGTPVVPPATGVQPLLPHEFGPMTPSGPLFPGKDLLPQPRVDMPPANGDK